MELADLHQKGHEEPLHTIERREKCGQYSHYTFPLAILWCWSISMTFNRIKMVFLFLYWYIQKFIRPAIEQEKGINLLHFQPQGS